MFDFIKSGPQTTINMVPCTSTFSLIMRAENLYAGEMISSMHRMEIMQLKWVTQGVLFIPAHQLSYIEQLEREKESTRDLRVL